MQLVDRQSYHQESSSPQVRQWINECEYDQCIDKLYME